MKRTLASLLTATAAACHMDSRFIYYPQSLSAYGADAIGRRHPAAEAITITAADGVQLRGWLVNHRAPQPRPLVLYFGGNAEEVSYLLADAKRLEPCALGLVNYRGYGLSEGKPSEAALFADALLVYDALAARPEIDESRVVVWGRSLGTGVATHVAANRPVAGVILTSPYDSMTALAERHMPGMRLFLTQHFDSLAKAPGIRAPLLALAAEHDALVPVQHSARLVAAWGGPKEFVRLARGDHNTLALLPDYWTAIERFLHHTTAVSGKGS